MYLKMKEVVVAQLLAELLLPTLLDKPGSRLAIR